jgi:uncharacterized Zn-finger protein
MLFYSLQNYYNYLINKKIINNDKQYKNGLLQRKDSYNEHLLIHNGPRHKCPHCPKEFVQRSNLVRHIRIHTGQYMPLYYTLL